MAGRHVNTLPSVVEAILSEVKSIPLPVFQLSSCFNFPINPFRRAQYKQNLRRPITGLDIFNTMPIQRERKSDWYFSSRKAKAHLWSRDGRKSLISLCGIDESRGGAMLPSTASTAQSASCSDRPNPKRLSLSSLVSFISTTTILHGRVLLHSLRESPGSQSSALPTIEAPPLPSYENTEYLPMAM